MKFTGYNNKIRLFRVILSFIGVCLFLKVSGQSYSKTFNIEFSDKNIAVSKEGSFSFIRQNNEHCFYLEDSLRPCIPYINKYVLIPQNAIVKSVSFSATDSLFVGDLILPSNTKLTSNNVGNDYCVLYNDSITYPSCICERYFQESIDGYNLLGVQISPFVYNALNNRLFIKPEITVNIQYELDSLKSSHQYGRMYKSTIEEIVLNKEDLDIYYPDISLYSTSMNRNYLIITADSLKEVYTELVNWKKFKGIDPTIKTIEEINASYQGVTLQEKIKRCIYEIFDRYGLRYVLLGGDVDIIPTQNCYPQKPLGTIKDKYVPTDYYYSCFDNNFQWDGNNNGIIGESTDNISISSNLIISRIPLNNKSDITACISSIKMYEMGEIPDSIYNKVVFAGAPIKDSIIYNNGWSDTHYDGDSIYRTYIMPYSDIRYKYFYKTGTNMFNEEDFFNQLNFMSMLESGGNVTYVNCHGLYDTWNMYRFMFWGDKALELDTTYIPYIISSSCQTNNFEKYGSLSEAFFKNKKCHTIGYIGYTTECLGSKLKFYWGDATILESMLTEEIFKNRQSCIGSALVNAKSKYMLKYKYNTYDITWHLMSLNLLGDPECNIFADKPIKFNNIGIVQTQGRYKINTGENSCTLSLVRCFENNGIKYNNLLQTKSGQVFDVPYYNNSTYKYYYSITKNGYKPYIMHNLNLTDLFIQNQVYTDDFEANAKNIRIGGNVTNKYQEGEVCVSEGFNVTLTATESFEISNDFICEKGATLTINAQ